MAKRIRFNRKNRVIGNLKKAVVVSLASVMMLQSFAAPVHAADTDTVACAPEVNGEYEDFMSGSIKKIAGKIPVVGDYLDIFLDPILKSIFGTEDNIATKLDEISSKLDDLSLQLGISTEAILKEEYAKDLNEFNNEITNIRDLTSEYLNKISNIEKGNYSPAEKALKLSTMFVLDSGNTQDYINLIRNASTYIAGKNVDTSPSDPVYVRAFKLKCSESVFGGEAATRAGAYVNEVYTIMDAAYKVESLALDARLGLVNALFGENATEGEYDVLKEKYAHDPDALKLLGAAKNGNDIGTWTDAANKVTTTYNALYSLDNADSIASKYNTMIKNYKYCYIKGADYGKIATISFVPLSTNMNFTKYYSSGLGDEKHQLESYVKCYEDIDAKVKAGGLDTKDINKIMTHMAENSKFFSKDHESTTAYYALNDYGFGIVDEINYSTKFFKYFLKTWDDVMNWAKPIIVGASWREDHGTKAYISGYDLMSDKNRSIHYAYADGYYSELIDETNRTLLFFHTTAMPENPFDNASNDDLTALLDNMDSAMTAALTASDVEDVDAPEENNGENNEETAITLTVDPEGQIIGESEGDAWTLEDSVLTLKADHKFRFEGDLKDLNIINYGEITGGNFINVNMELENGASITEGTFENGKITVHEGAVIDPNVILTDTEVVDAEENTEEENKGEEEEENNTDTDITEIADQN